MWHKLLIILFSIIFTVPCFAQGFPPLGISDEGGAVSRPVFVLDCSGAGVECSHSGVTGTITVSGGSGDHDAVTLAGQDYLSLSTQQITANLINGDNINWSTVQDLVGDTQINWTAVQGITGSNINWTLIDEDVITGVNWTSYEYSLPTATDSVLGGVKVGSGLAISEGVLSASAASTSAAGIVELAIASEVNTGTSATLAVTPDSLAGSTFGKRVVSIKLTADGGSALTVGNGKFIYLVPAELNGMNLVGVSAGVSTASSSGNPEFQIHNLTDTQDMLSTTLTIDATEYHSKDATTAAVINTSYDDVATGDRLRIDVDTAGTGTKGVQIDLVFQLP